ncbi:ester cyclase [Chitinophaga sp. CF118]|uniref:ester cyclase n=1 Tax=Chitinophaga sp. CF118 TaxID=1884367 RepID=UPI0015A59B95|nr:ester cyclase [Chitinophaga sp. CF118]
MERNKEVIRKLYEESLNKRNMALLSDFISEDYIGVQGKKGAAGFEENVTPLIKAFPDMQWEIKDLIGEGNKVVVRWKLHGTHTASFRNIAATGKLITNDGIGIYELNDGKVTDTYILTDRLGFQQELEVLPLDLTLLARKSGKDNVRFIDKFLVPANAKNEFYERVRINRNFIKQLPGFIEDAAYERTDENGNLICITVALWENAAALNKAKEAVQAEYKKQGVDMPAMLKRLNVIADRGVYSKLDDY